MRRFVLFLIAAVGCAGATATPASARPLGREQAPHSARMADPDRGRGEPASERHYRRNRDQDIAFEARRQGRIMPLRSIESRVIPQMRGADYLGPELLPGSDRYRLKFYRRGPGRVIWVDVDARTGRVVGTAGD